MDSKIDGNFPRARHERSSSYQAIQFRERLANAAVEAIKADLVEFEFTVGEDAQSAIKIYGPDSIFRGDYLSSNRDNTESVMAFDTSYLLLLTATWAMQERLELI